jgi:hypothetical protein
VCSVGGAGGDSRALLVVGVSSLGFTPRRDLRGVYMYEDGEIDFYPGGI